MFLANRKLAPWGCRGEARVDAGFLERSRLEIRGEFWLEVDFGRRARTGACPPVAEHACACAQNDPHWGQEF